MKVIFLGDISFNDKYIELQSNGIDPFSALKPFLSCADFVVGNLECMVNGNDGVNEKKKPRLETTIKTLNYLKNINLSLVCLANNHVFDHLEDGFNQTTGFLIKNQIAFIGASIRNEEYKKSYIFEKDGIKVAVLNYVTHDTNPYPPERTRIRVNFFDERQVIEEIKLLRNRVNHIVLYIHWGGKVEGGMFPDLEQPKIAKRLINAGADLIIGHHSHTVQPNEVYKGKYIFYSLGNFCFSDFWFEGEFYPLSKRNKFSNIVDITFYESSYTAKSNYYFNNLNSYKKKKIYYRKVIIRNFLYKLLFKNSIGWGTYSFYIHYILPLILFVKRNDLSYKIKIIRLKKYLQKRLLIK